MSAAASSSGSSGGGPGGGGGKRRRVAVKEEGEEDEKDYRGRYLYAEGNLAQLSLGFHPAVVRARGTLGKVEASFLRDGYALLHPDIYEADGLDTYTYRSGDDPFGILEDMARSFFTQKSQEQKLAFQQDGRAGHVTAQGARIPKHGYVEVKEGGKLVKEVLDICWEGQDKREDVGIGGFATVKTIPADQYPRNTQPLDLTTSYMTLAAMAQHGLEAVAEALNIRGEDLKSMLDTHGRLARGEASSSYLSLIHYPGGKRNKLKELAPAHVDGGLITLVYADQPGLQVRLRDGTWGDVPPQKVALLVGAQLERATGGAVRAVEHRVVAAKSSSNQPPRFALVFKLRARPGAILDPRQFAETIVVDMPLLRGPATRKPILVVDFEEAFAADHPSITYAARSAVKQEEGAAASAAASSTSTAAAAAQQQQEQPGFRYPWASFQITVKTLTGKSLQVNVSLSTTVLGLKQAIHGREGIPSDQQNLIFGGELLRNEEWALTAYNVRSGSTVCLVLKLRGD